MTLFGSERPFVSSDSTLSMRIAHSLVNTAEQSGAPASSVLKLARLTRTLEDPDARLSRADFYRLCEAALELTPAPAFALRWSRHLSAGALEPIATLVAHSETLGDALTTLAQYHQVLCDDPGYRIHHSRDSLTLRCLSMEGASERVQRFLGDVSVGCLLGLLRRFGASGLPERVCFAHAAPSCNAQYVRAFGGRAQFDESFTGLVLARQQLSARPALRDPALQAALRAFVEQRIASQTQGISYAARVRSLLIRSGVTRRVGMAEVSRALQVSERTLRRRLASEDTNFAEVVTSALCVTAKHWLSGERYSIEETAYELGFQDKSAFHRAFKRWTGLTPGVFRRQQAALAREHVPAVLVS